MKSEREFLAQYMDGPEHRPDWAGHSAFELEGQFALRGGNTNTQLVYPVGHLVYNGLMKSFPNDQERFSPEFSNTQVELNTGACATPDLTLAKLLELVGKINQVAGRHNFQFVDHEFIPLNVWVPEQVSPLVPRYQQFANDPANVERVPLMHRVAAAQVQWGCADPEERLALLNALTTELGTMESLGWIDPGRKAAFEKIHAGWYPPPFDTWSRFYEYIRSHQDGVAMIESPALYYAAVRPHHVYSTVELRLPGATLDPERLFQIVSFVAEVYSQVCRRRSVAV